MGKFGTGHLLVANETSDGATFDIMDRMREAGWVRAISPGATVPLVVDQMVVYKQQEYGGADVPIDTYEICADDLSVDVALQPRNDDQLNSIVIAAYGTAPGQPGDFTTARPGGIYCTDDLMEIRWRPVPQSCYEQRGIDHVIVDITFEVFDGNQWVEVTAQDVPNVATLVGLDDVGAAYWNICGAYPPYCPTGWYGDVPWRAQLQMHAHVGQTNFMINAATSDQFWILQEISPPCTKGGCPYVGGITSEGHVLDNNVLAYSGDGSSLTDHYTLRIAPVEIDSLYHLTLSETAADVSSIDSVGLVVVDHRAESRVTVSHDGSIRCFTTTTPVRRALDDTGESVVRLLATEGDTLNVHKYRDEFVTMSLGVADSTSALFVVSDIKHEIGSILVQVPADSSGWTTVGTLEPRDTWGEDLIPLRVLGYAAGDTVSVRLLWTEEHKVDYVGLVSGEATARVTPLPLVYAEHSALGDVLSELSAADADRTPLAAEDMILLGFAAPPEIENARRDYIFITTGSWTRPDGNARHPALAVSAEATMRIVGARPASGPVAMQVQLPRRARTSLRVFDVQGRLVRTLLDESVDPGLHVVTWDLRDTGERRVARGVYFARLEAVGSSPTVEKLHVLH